MNFYLYNFESYKIRAKKLLNIYYFNKFRTQSPLLAAEYSFEYLKIRYEDYHSLNFNKNITYGWWLNSKNEWQFFMRLPFKIQSLLSKYIEQYITRSQHCKKQ